MTDTESDAGDVYENILVDLTEGVTRITLNRPSRFNALNGALLDELHEALLGADEDPDVGAVVITGSPETKKPAFAAGADIGEMAGMGVEQLRAFAQAGQEVFATIEKLGKPVIAALNGLALGGGCELALACHIRYASDAALIGQPEINLGLIPGFGGSQRLPRLVGRGAALEILLGGDPVKAPEALRIGLVDRVLPHDELPAAVLALARKLASKAPIARERIIELVWRGMGCDLDAALRIEADLFGGMAATEDTQEGLQAFLEKREATWKGC